MPINLNETKKEIEPQANTGIISSTLRRMGSLVKGKIHSDIRTEKGIYTKICISEENSKENIAKPTIIPTEEGIEFQSILSSAYLSRDMEPVNIFIEAVANQC